MFEQIGATFGLSSLMLIAAALILYQPEPPLSEELTTVWEEPAPSTIHSRSQRNEPSSVPEMKTPGDEGTPGIP